MTLAKFGSDGRLEVRGRADDIIISGGEKISPAAITELLRSHFPRTELLLLGIPDQEWGQSLRLIATKSDETDALTLKVCARNRCHNLWKSSGASLSATTLRAAD